MRTPQAPQWERTAVSWLLDLCPPEYRGYPVLGRYPLALARLALLHTEAGVEAGRRALASARADFADVLPAPALTEVIEVIEVEQARLIAARRAVTLVGRALRGERYVPRL